MKKALEGENTKLKSRLAEQMGDMGAMEELRKYMVKSAMTREAVAAGAPSQLSEQQGCQPLGQVARWGATRRGVRRLRHCAVGCGSGQLAVVARLRR